MRVKGSGRRHKEYGNRNGMRGWLGRLSAPENAFDSAGIFRIDWFFAKIGVAAVSESGHANHVIMFHLAIDSSMSRSMPVGVQA
jgi:hypothetical protein